jgi:hypothetical protein
VTAPDPSVTVPVPDPGPAPVVVVPKPDPGPVKVVSKPKPHVVVHPVYQAPAAPAVVVQPSVASTTPKVAKPRVAPKHVVTRPKHHVKPKQPTHAQVTKPKPAAAKPKLPTIAVVHESARTGGGWASFAWSKLALVAGLALLLLSAVLAVIRRAARKRSGAAVAPAVEATSANGSSPALQDGELVLLELELKAHAERADALEAELAPFQGREELIPEALLAAAQAANELRDSAEATLRKARRLADRIVEEAARRRTRLEARNAALKLELTAQAERADELEAELAQYHARETV